MLRRLLVDVDAPPQVVGRAVETHLGGAGDEPTGALVATVSATDAGSRVELALTDELHIPYFGWFFAPLIRRDRGRRLGHAAQTLRAVTSGDDPPAPFRSSRFLPPVAYGPDQIRLVATVAALAALANFGGALFGQYGAPVAESFDASDARLGAGLAVTRLGILVSLFAAALADRRGRRKLILASFTGVAIANGLSAMAPSFELFVAPQVFTRALTTATLVVAGIAAVEQAPERARAYSVAMLALAAGAGFAIAVALLPIADLGTHGWRVPFLLSAATLLFLWPLAKNLSETDRFRDLARRTEDRGHVREVFDRLYRFRFLALALTAFLTNVFSAPAAQLTNRYLIDDQGFSNTMIAAFRGVTNGLPGLVGIMIAGYLAERRGRRPLAIVALAVGTVFQMVVFLGDGPMIWVASTVSIVAAACAGLAISTYSSELFPTEIRGTSNALLVVCGVAGAVTGLLVATNLDALVDDLGTAIAVCGIAPLLAAAFVVPFLPETKGRALDVVSPSEV